MEERAAVPVSLPHLNPTMSYWQDPPDEIADFRTSDTLPETAEIVIIGSGITGAAVAWHLLERGHSNILMLEARQACSGATGRNGGHTKAASYRSFLQHAHKYGTEMAVKIAQLELDNIRAMHAFARQHSIACDSHPCETIDVIYDRAQWEQGKLAIQAMREVLPGHPAAEYRLCAADEVRQKFYCGEGGDENVCGGIAYEAGSINAYKLVIGILKLCLKKGLNFQTNTPALKLEKLPNDQWKIHTQRGDVRAKRVILATNGYTAQLMSSLQGAIVPLRGHVTAQRPGQAMPHGGLPSTYTFIYSGGYEYMTSRPTGSRNEGDIVIGGGLGKIGSAQVLEYGTTDDSSGNESISRILLESLPGFFGSRWGKDHIEGRLRKQWSGIMGYSADGLPLVGQVPGETNLWMSCSFQGHGMALCLLCARALVSMIDGDDIPALDAWFPSIFRVSSERIGQKFQGRLHTSAQ